MTAHIDHGDIHEHGLADGCPRCEEHADNPFVSLDDHMLENLIQLAVSPDRFGRARSEAEMVASATVLTALERAGRMFSVAPGYVSRYFSDRWGVRRL